MAASRGVVVILIIYFCIMREGFSGDSQNAFKVLQTSIIPASTPNIIKRGIGIPGDL